MADEYEGTKLLDLAKETVRLLLRAFSSFDRIAVFAVADDYWFLSNVTETDTCFHDTFAKATQRNLEIISFFLNQLEPKGGTNYINAVSEAFKFFHSSDAEAYAERLESEKYEVKFLRRSGWGGFTFPNVADINVMSQRVMWFLNFPVCRVLEELQGLENKILDRMIIFLSDGSPNDIHEDIEGNLRNLLHLVNDSIRVITIGIGNEAKDFSILRAMTKANPVKEGSFINVNSFDGIWEKIMQLFEKYDPVSMYATSPNWTLPYNDKFTFAETITASLPVFINRKFVGVVGVDYVLASLLDEVQFEAPNEFTYFFISNTKEEVIYHPLLPHNATSRLFVRSDSYERSMGFQRILEMLRKSENGSTTLNGSHFREFGGSKFYGAEETTLPLKHFWSPIKGVPFTVVLVTSESLVPVAPLKFSSNDTLIYHRFDLVPPDIPCWHAFQTATMAKGSFFLPPNPFNNSHYLTSNLNPSQIKKITDYLSNKANSSNSLGIKEAYVTDLATLSEAQQLWFLDQEENNDLRSSVIYRYFVTTRRSMLVYPGVQLPFNYDPLSRQWYIHIVSNKEYPYVMTTPYFDAGTNILVITIGRTIFYPRGDNGTENKLYGVVALDVIVPSFNGLFLDTYPFCRWDLRFICYLIDTGGFLILVSHWKTKDYLQSDYHGKLNFNKHITELEPSIAAHLIEKNIMKILKCGIIGIGGTARSYRIEKTSYAGEIRVSFYNTFHFRLVDVKNTNTLILVRTVPTSRCFPGHFSCPCSSGPICDSTETDVRSCKCPCGFSNINYTYCTNRYTNLEFSPPPCLAFSRDHAGDDFGDEVLDSRPKGWPFCYPLNMHEEEPAKDYSWDLIALLVAISLIIVFSFIYYLYWDFRKKLRSAEEANFASRPAVVSDKASELSWLELREFEDYRKRPKSERITLQSRTWPKQYFAELKKPKAADDSSVDPKKEDSSRSVFKKISTIFFGKSTASKATLSSVKETNLSARVAASIVSFTKRVTHRHKNVTQRIRRNVEEIRALIKADPSTSTSAAAEEHRVAEVTENVKEEPSQSEERPQPSLIETTESSIYQPLGKI